MIPRVIHYCWFGGNPLSPFAEKCIKSWKKYCPEYEIKEWNEGNFDITCNKYVQEAHNAKKWAFVSDVARLIIVYNNGGIYLDTDVELRKPLDNLLNHDMYMGFEQDGEVNSGVGFGAVKEFPLLRKMIEIYSSAVFINPDGTLNMTTCNIYAKPVLQKEGFVLNDEYQSINGLTIYPSEYFSPKRFSASTNTYSIHYYALSWKDENEGSNKIKIHLMIIFGAKIGSFICNGLYVYRTTGICGVWNKIRGREWRGAVLK